MKNYISKSAGRYAANAEAKNEFKDKTETEAIVLLTMLYGDQTSLVSAHPYYELLLSMVKGYLHASGEDRSPKYEDTVNLGVMENHMGSSYRRDKEPMFIHMLKAAFDEVVFSKPHAVRYVLHDDLSDVYIKFNDELKKAGEKEVAMNLFTYDSPE